MENLKWMCLFELLFWWTFSCNCSLRPILVPNKVHNHSRSQKAVHLTCDFYFVLSLLKGICLHFNLRRIYRHGVETTSLASSAAWLSHHFWGSMKSTSILLALWVSSVHSRRVISASFMSAIIAKLNKFGHFSRSSGSHSYLFLLIN